MSFASIPSYAERPDWIILGIRRKPGDGVCLYASKSLRSIEMEMDFGADYGFFGVAQPLTRSSITLTAVLTEYVFVIAASYREAILKLGDLFDAWERDERWTIRAELTEVQATIAAAPFELGPGE